MPMNVPIQAIPNQTLTITINGVNYEISLRTILDFTAVSIVINGVETVDGLRIPAGSPLLPYQYEENGNFIFANSGGFQLPFYTYFNLTQTLLYYSPAELASFRSVPAPVFNPLGALPLRYKPTGYVEA